MQSKQISLNYATTHPIKYALIGLNIKLQKGQEVRVKIGTEINKYRVLSIHFVEIYPDQRKFFFVVKQLDLFAPGQEVKKEGNPKPLEFGIFSEDFFSPIRAVKGSFFRGNLVKLEPCRN
jgi:hypothetical protein